ncbi:NOC2L-like protein, partial [Mya arenaria]
MAASMKKGMSAKKRKLGDLSVDEFMAGNMDSSDSESDAAVSTKQKASNKKRKDKKLKSTKSVPAMKGDHGVMLKHKTSLQKLQAQDPEFYAKKKENDGKKQKGNNIDKPAKEKGKKKKVEEAKKNEEETTKKSKDKKKKNADKKEEIVEKVEKVKKSDKKLKLEVEKKKKGNKAAVTEESDSEEDMDDEEIKFDMDSSDSDEEGMVHTLPDELEVMTDSDEEVGGTEQRSGRASVTSAMVKQWTKRFKSQPSPALLHEAVHAFKAAVQHTATESAATKYKVEGAKVYNAVVRMCLIEIPGALHKILSLSTTPDLQKPILPSTNDQKWRKIKVDVKSYLADVLQLMTGLSESNMVNVLLKHVHRLIAFYACFPKLTKLMLKRVINQWSSGEETSRILAFLCVNRMIRVNQEAHLENCVKQMYMAYVRNSKFTSPNTLPLINFMQRSFVEILVLDYSLAYQYAFIYIRQLAIHLRNAITTKKKESCQAVYNWQFIHCIGLWTRVLCTMYPNDIMEPLIYPLTQVIIGTIKLVPTQRYYPLRFHCVRALTEICKATRTFIPVLPFLME